MPLAVESKIQECLVNGWMLRGRYKILIRKRYMIMDKLFSYVNLLERYAVGNIRKDLSDENN